jgi:predicted permease
MNWAFWGRKRRNEELDEELKGHLTLGTREEMEAGRSLKQAESAARRQFGNEALISETARDMWGFRWLTDLAQDLRYGLRGLRKSPGFTAVAILTLALGIGANTAVFTLVDAVMLKSLPVPQPDQLYRLGDWDNCCQMTGTQNYGSFVLYSYPLYKYLRQHTDEFSGLTAFSPSLNFLSVRRSGVQTAAEPAIGEYVSGDYFETLGVRPLSGRLLTAGDDGPNSPPAAVMSYHTWEQYGHDPSVVGATLAFDGHPMTVVGVAPPSFFGETLRSDPPDFWIPLSQEPVLNSSGSLLNLPGEWWLYVIGRMKPDEQASLVQSHLTVELQQWLRQAEWASGSDAALVQKARWLARQHIHLTPAGSGVTTFRSATSRSLLLLTLVSGIVLLIACANIASLLLARGTANRQQIAIRVALGAGRSRLIKQTVTDGMLLALIGGTAGLAVAFAGARAILLLAFRNALYVPIDPRPSLPILAFTLLLSLLTGVIFSIAPCWMTSHTRPMDALREARSILDRSVLPRKTFVVVQAALSLILLVGAGLLTKSLYNLEHQQFGFDTQGRLLVRVNPELAGYTQKRLPELYQRIEQDLSKIPGVLNVSLSVYSPLEGTNPNVRVSIEGRSSAANPTESISWDQVSAQYFQTIGTHVLRGRGFTPSDTAGSAQIAVINDAFARNFFPNDDPMGKRFGMGDTSHSGDFEIVGVVQNAKYFNASEPAKPMFFLPLLQSPAFINDVELHVAGHLQNLDFLVRETIDSVDPNLTVLGMMSLGEQVDLNFSRERLIASLTLLYGLLALVLASVGLYGVGSYVVARRTKEIGIRMALGAKRIRIVAMVLRDSMLQVGLGLMIGAPVALMEGRVLSGTLFGVKGYDPLVLAVAVIALVTFALLATLIPARRAIRVDPMTALRHE